VTGVENSDKIEDVLTTQDLGNGSVKCTCEVIKFNLSPTSTL